MFTEGNAYWGELVVGILVGVAVTTAFSFPRVGRAIGKTVAVVLMGLGTGLIMWSIIGLRSEKFDPMQFGPVTLISAAHALGWGVGTLVAGITALVLSFVGPPPRKP